MNYERPSQPAAPPRALSVEVRVMHAHANALAHSLNDKSDCYVTIEVARTGETRQTPICWNSAVPMWYHSFLFSDVILNDMFRLRLAQQHNISSPTIIGSCDVPVLPALSRSMSILTTWHYQPGSRIHLDAAHQRQLSQDYVLGGGSDGVSLVIVDHAYVLPLDRTCPAVAYKQFVIHKFINALSRTRPLECAKSALSKINSTARKIHPVLDLSNPVSHLIRANSTFAMKLSLVEHYFGKKRQGWNKDYPAAQRIFAGPTSPAMKAALVAQHMNLYGKFLEHDGGGGTLRHQKQASTGALLDGMDFLALLSNGIRNGKSRLYTYVITEDELRFAETGAAFQKDMDSKHAMHNCADAQVVYAGEMHFRRRITGRSPSEPEFTLVVDNASGTYAPDSVDLPRVRALLMSNFQGLNVEALDFKDPLLKKYLEAVSKT